MGTKRARDLVTDINFAPEPIWVEGAEMSPSEQVGRTAVVLLLELVTMLQKQAGKRHGAPWLHGGPRCIQSALL
jgi:hypothetical protein